jgi:signal transduction histidine kinase
MRVAGVAYPLSALGEQSISRLTLAPDQNHLDIEVAASCFRIGSLIRYQYRLAGSNEWSLPAEMRTISLAGLGAGNYELEVRAIRDGVASSIPARVSFQILPPVWRRWWVISLGTVFMTMLLYFAHRYRLSQVVEMERVRTRIAMDLHDDIGSTLSQVSILSEVARQQTGDGPASLTLARLAEISRGLAVSMGDIVWAVNPQRGRGADLIQRMRRFGEDLLSGCDVTFDCTAADPVLDTAIPADVRREVYLVFKESVNNIARHAKCQRVSAQLAIASGELQLEVRDDGQGFDASTGGDRQGHGLASMQRRAEQVGGTLKVISEAERGTTILMRVPLRRYLFR